MHTYYTEFFTSLAAMFAIAAWCGTYRRTVGTMSWIGLCTFLFTLTAAAPEKGWGLYVVAAYIAAHWPRVIGFRWLAPAD